MELLRRKRHSTIRMNVAQIFRAVSEGRVLTRAGYSFSCPECGAVLKESRSQDRRDRSALTHCLLHTFNRFERILPPMKNPLLPDDLFHSA